MKGLIAGLIGGILFLTAAIPVSAQRTGTEEQEKVLPFLLPTKGSEPTLLVERVTSDLRTYRDGTYIEHVRREERGRIDLKGNPLTGTYYILENVIRGAVDQGNRVDKSLSFHLSSACTLKEWTSQKAPYPRFRPFPSLGPSLPVTGDTWKERMTMALYPDQSGEAIIVPVTATFRFDGTGSLGGKRVYLVTGTISMKEVPSGGTPVQRIEGRHSLSIAFSADSYLPLFIKNRLEETFQFADGREKSYKGFINHWISYSVKDEAETLEAVKKEIDSSGTRNVEVAETEEGPALRIRDLHFLPDQAVLLGGEEMRIARIANILKNTGKGNILVIGHTADVGNPEGELRLSIARAKTVTDLLIQQGIDPGRVMYDGRGSGDPIGDNRSEAGRAKNRRVEIVFIDPPGTAE